MDAAQNIIDIAEKSVRVTRGFLADARDTATTAAIAASAVEEVIKGAGAAARVLERIYERNSESVSATSK